MGSFPLKYRGGDRITEKVNEKEERGVLIQQTLTGEKISEISKNKKQREIKKNRRLGKNKSKNRGLRKYSGVRNWLQNKSEKTKKSYLSVLAYFTEFTGANPKELIEEVRKRNFTNRKEKDLVELEIIRFYDWLTEEKLKEKPIECGKRVDYTGEKGLSKKTANNYISTIRSFFNSNGVSLMNFRI